MLLSRSLIALTCCAAVLAGCNSASTQATAEHTDVKSNAIPGWTEVKSSGVAISLPSELPVLDLSAGDVSKIQGKINKDFAGSADVQKVVKNALTNGKLKLMALERTESTPGFRNSFNLLVIDSQPGLTIDKLNSASVKLLESMCVPGSVKGEVTKLKAGDCSHIDATMKTPKFSYDIASYTILHGSKQFVFTFSRGKHDDAKWTDIAKKAMDTVHFTD